MFDKRREEGNAGGRDEEKGLEEAVVVLFVVVLEYNDEKVLEEAEVRRLKIVANLGGTSISRFPLYVILYYIECCGVRFRLFFNPG